MTVKTSNPSSRRPFALQIGKGNRLLDHGETVLEGDEYFVGGEWYTIDLTTFVGDSNMVAFFRRKVAP